jgi:hypothetical protein
MGDLPQALPKTVIAADNVRRHAPRMAIERRATDLLQAAARADIAVPDRRAVPPDLLRELVAISGALAGRKWLRANAASPTVQTFISLSTASRPPDPPVLDQVLSALLWGRFSNLGAASSGRRKTRDHPAGSRLARFGARRHRATA